jgi:hypothetical protein
LPCVARLWNGEDVEAVLAKQRHSYSLIGYPGKNDVASPSFART